MPNWGGTAEKCKVCQKTVYEMEKLTIEQVVYHKTCFKCAKCAKVLRMGDFTAIQGEVFCKPHFKQLFQVKGNYEEGFKQALQEAQKAAQVQEGKKKPVEAPTDAE